MFHSGFSSSSLIVDGNSLLHTFFIYNLSFTKGWLSVSVVMNLIFISYQNLSSLFMNANSEKWESWLPLHPLPFDTYTRTLNDSCLKKEAEAWKTDRSRNCWQLHSRDSDRRQIKRKDDVCLWLLQTVAATSCSRWGDWWGWGWVRGAMEWHSAWFDCRFVQGECAVTKGFMHFDVRGEREREVK